VTAYGRYITDSDGWDDGFNGMRDSGEGSSKYLTSFAEPDYDDWFAPDDGGGPSVDWLLGELERELWDHQAAELDDGVVAEEVRGSCDAEKMLQLWLRAWGPCLVGSSIAS
jgi:hypothetical protein